MRVDNPTISFEFFPPKSAEGEENLFEAIRALDVIKPNFVSVTYGAGGSTRERTIKIACDIFEKTGYRTIAHLTCVGATRAEVYAILQQFEQAGITDILALRGDPAEGPTAPWITTPDGFDHADELVQMAQSFGSFEIGVAAFPDVHPSATSFEQGVDVLMRKEELGATFAVTQFVFRPESYVRLAAELARRGSGLTIYPGIMPVTSYRQFIRMLDFANGEIPDPMMEQYHQYEHDREGIREIGIDIATRVSEEVLDAGAEGLHFYTLNTASSTLEVIKRIGVRAH
ncbi:MAG: methylenetetrahydrofolate reductase [Actinomycetales bacterium]|jgi:methylenetetrahydrofolate reductase (NADPH)|nr:methylenetetrahydrofolate reductase [Actinomycetales bacterium]